MNMKYALLSIKKNIKNAKELKSSFIISIVGMCINNIAFLVLWYYFGAIVGNLNGWESIDIFGLYGINSTSFGIVCAFLYGIYNIPSYISSGNFDKYLFFGRNINNNAGIKFKVTNINMIGIIISFFEEALFIFLSV